MEGEHKSNEDKETWVILSPCLGLKNSLRMSTGTCRTGCHHLQLTPRKKPEPPPQLKEHTRTHSHKLSSAFSPVIQSVCVISPLTHCASVCPAHGPLSIFIPVLTWKCHNLVSCVGPLEVYVSARGVMCMCSSVKAQSCVSTLALPVQTLIITYCRWTIASC